MKNIIGSLYVPSKTTSANSKELYNAIENGNTPLHLAVLEKNIDQVKNLIEKDANINITNNEGQKPQDLVNSNDFQLKEIFNQANKKQQPQTRDNERPRGCSIM